MLKKNTSEIIIISKQIAAHYDELCRTFFGKPGKEGIDRKVKFLQIVSTLDNDTKEEAFTKLYQFYQNEKKTSRLIKILEDQLASLVGIKIPSLQVYHHGKSNIVDVNEAKYKFVSRAKTITEQCGMETNRDVILTTFWLQK